MSKSNSIFVERAENLKLVAIMLMQHKFKGEIDKLSDDGLFRKMLDIKELVSALNSNWLNSMKARIELLTYLHGLSDDYRDFT